MVTFILKREKKYFIDNVDIVHKVTETQINQNIVKLLRVV